MGYNYETMKPKVFTESGQRILLSIFKNIERYRLFGNKNRMNVNKMIKSVCGDTWTMLACINYLEELGEIKLVKKGDMAQFNVYLIEK